MSRIITSYGGLAAGMTLGGLIAGLGEAVYRQVELTYSALLYGSLWAIGGLAASLALAMVWRGPPRAFITIGLVTSLFCSTLVLVRFLALRDLFHEAPEQRWVALGMGLGAAVVAVLPIWLVSRWLRRRFFADRLPSRGLWLVPLAVAIAFITLTQAGSDDVREQLPAASGARGGQGVILIVVDTLRADVLGAYGAPLHRDAPPSPSFDAFAAAGVRFTDVTAQASWTKPAVASLLTSRHVSGHDTMSKMAVLPAGLPTLAGELQRAGVRTGAVVTNYNLEQGYGFDRGFDEYVYLPPARYLGAPARANRLAAYNVYRMVRERLLAGQREARYFYRSAAAVNAAGLEFLDRVGDDKFFLYLHYMEPHDPYFSEEGTSFARVSTPNPAAHLAEPMRLAYRDEVRRWDAGFAQLLTALQARGLADRVTLIVTSDHGEEFLDHGGWWHGSTLYQEQLHLPLAVRGPGVAPRVDVDLARQIDVAPTVLGRFGVAAPASWEGRDLLGSTPPPAAVLAEQDHDGNVLTAVRQGSRKLILANDGNPRGLPRVELFDLSRDPTEKSPLGADDAGLAPLTELTQRLRAAAAKGGAQAASRPVDAEVEAELRSLGYVH